MYTEDQLLPISALQHWLFCPRQCGLIHLEQLWDENRLTAEGRLLHEKVHDADTENRPGIRIVRDLRIHSYQLGLIGQTDVVEFHKVEKTWIPGQARNDKDTAEGDCATLNPKRDASATLGNPLPASPYPNTNGASSPLAGNPLPASPYSPFAGGELKGWRVFPVEYKRGSPKIGRCDEVQLCAQAMCLEEMLKTAIPQGAFFYGKPRRRKEIDISDELRQQTEDVARQLHELIDGRVTPTARYEKKCDACSLYNRCMPKTTGMKKKVDVYLEKAFEISDFRDSIDD